MALLRDSDVQCWWHVSRKTMPREIVMCSPKSSCNKIRATIQLKGTAVSSSTVSRRLLKWRGLKSHRPVRKPHLSPVMKKKTPSPLDSRWVEERVFGEECTIQQFVPRHMHITRPLGKHFDKKCVVAKMFTREPNDLRCHVVQWRCWFVFHSA